jgi:hypothetical protein
LKKPVNYVSNKKFYEELVRYRAMVNTAKMSGLPLPTIPNYIGECLILIANRLSNKPNFVAYPHKDEMIADGIENCIRYLDLFDPDRSKNPFAYFTQAIKMAFIRRIKNEKRQLYLKFKSSQTHYLTEQLNDNTIIVTDNEVMNNFIQDYEDAIKKKKLEGKK